ncbi:hypothetical protein DTW90_22720 [Neorhizobium sp. P12A]|nr:hypothetical protein DTW90_22720 [Neorhizobium sp. P12A]
MKALFNSLRRASGPDDPVVGASAGRNKAINEVDGPLQAHFWSLDHGRPRLPLLEVDDGVAAGRRDNSVVVSGAVDRNPVTAMKIHLAWHSPSFQFE